MNTLLVNAKIVNEGKVVAGDVLIKDDRIEKIGSHLSSEGRVVDVKGKFLLPGVIDDQVHFREPGLTHKATIFSESRAAVAGGVTSYMEMPNTVPPTFTQELLEQKYQIAARDSLANYSFYMGTSSDNLDEILKTDLSRVCGLKIFMGSSTGNLLVDDPAILERIFSSFSGVIALHCEDEKTIRDNMETFRQQFGEDMPLEYHPQIRSEAGVSRFRWQRSVEPVSMFYTCRRLWRRSFSAMWYPFLKNGSQQRHASTIFGSMRGTTRASA